MTTIRTSRQTLRPVTATAHVESRRLLLDLGFALERQATIAGLDTVFYRIHCNRRAT